MFHERLGDPSQWKEGVANQVLPLLVVNLLPTGVLGIVVGAFLAGVVTNLDSYVNSASTLVVTDLYQAIVPQRSDRHYLRVGQALVVVFLVAGIALARLILRFGSVFEAFQTFMSFFQGPLLALLLLGMLTRWATSAGGLAGMIAGVGTAAGLHAPGLLWGREHAVSYLWVAWWSFAAALAGTAAVSLFTRRYDDERLRGLVCWIAHEEPRP
jgi:SSS family solute:Na+ symporter